MLPKGGDGERAQCGARFGIGERRMQHNLGGQETRQPETLRGSTIWRAGAFPHSMLEHTG